MPEAMSRSPRNSAPHATPGPVWASTLVVCTPVTAGGVVAAEGGVVDDGSPPADGVGVEALVVLVVLVRLAVVNGVGTTGGLCWFSSLTLVALPTLAWRFLAANSLYWETDWHYDLILMPVVFAAAIEVLARLSTSESRVARWYSQAVPLTLAGFAMVLVALSPAADVVRPSAWATTPRQEALEAALREIPPGAVVQSDLGLLSHLAGRNTAYWIGDTDGPVPSYIVTDDTAGWTPPPPDRAAAYFGEAYRGHTWEVVSAADGVVVLRLVT